MHLPMSVEDVSTEWLTAALGAQYPGVEVRHVKIDNVTHGMASRMRLLLEYNEAGSAAELPPTMWVKTSFHELRGYVWDIGLYENEVAFYTDVAAGFPARMPKCYLALTDPSQQQALLLLEDLTARGVTFGRATRPLDIPTTKATLDLQARFHAALWESPVLDELAWLQDPLRGGTADFFRTKTPEVVTSWFDRAQAWAVPTAFHDPELLITAFWKLQEIAAQGPLCLLHGDTHLGNFYFEPDGSPGVVDWAACKKGQWAHDVAYFIIGSLDVTDRRTSEQDLLRFYLDALASHGVQPPSFDEAWLAYRQQVIYGLWAFLTNTDAYQSGLINTANTFRFGTAALDLDSFGALGC